MGPHPQHPHHLFFWYPWQYAGSATKRGPHPPSTVDPIHRYWLVTDGGRSYDQCRLPGFWYTPTGSWGHRYRWWWWYPILAGAETQINTRETQTGRHRPSHFYSPWTPTLSRPYLYAPNSPRLWRLSSLCNGCGGYPNILPLREC